MKGSNLKRKKNYLAQGIQLLPEADRLTVKSIKFIDSTKQLGK